MVSLAVHEVQISNAPYAFLNSLAYCDDPAAEGAQMIADKVTTARNRCIVSGGDAAEAEAAVRAEMEPQLQVWLHTP